MTPDSAERLSAWHAEIAEALAQARTAVTSLQASFDDAELAARQAEIAYRELRSMFSPIEVVVWPLGHTARLAGPIELRLAAEESDRDAARNRAIRARIDLEAARDQVAELERALDQINLLSPQYAEQEAA